MALGQGDYKYELVPDWPQYPAFFEFDGPEKMPGVVDAACDSQTHTVEKFSPDGKMLLCLGIRDWA